MRWALMGAGAAAPSMGRSVPRGGAGGGGAAKEAAAEKK